MVDQRNLVLHADSDSRDGLNIASPVAGMRRRLTLMYNGFKTRFGDIGRRWPFILSALIVIGGAVCGIASYLIVTGLTPIKTSRAIFALLLPANLAFVIIMLGLVVYQFYILFVQRRLRKAGTQLHARLVSLFALIAVMPAILVAVFALGIINQGLDRWFGERTKAIVSNTELVANAYLNEHRENLRSDAIVMAGDLNRAAGYFETDKKQFNSFLTAQAALRSINMALLINRDGVVLDVAKTRHTAPLPVPPAEAFEAADNNLPVIITASGRAQMWGLLRLNNFSDGYLYVMRMVDPGVLNQLQRTELAVREYTEWEKNRFEAQLTFILIYTSIALVILLAAIWGGLWIARSMARPIGQLITAAQKVSDGDLQARVKIYNRQDDVSLLGKTFNLMTERLAMQRKELIDAHDDMEARHQFTQMVLSGVSSGVIGVDGEGRINHINMQAKKIVGMEAEDMIGLPLGDTFPYFADLLHEADPLGDGNYEIEVKRDDGETRVLLVRIAQGEGDHGHDLVLTFDDVTSLLSAKKTAAWAGIARRIAHEIKNPLTPIQLSAERLRAKYDKEIINDPEVFRQCTDTIIRQVSDIGRMVDEFASFARMPSAVFKHFDVRDAVAQAIFLQRVAHPEITYEFDDGGKKHLMLYADRRLLSQALTNILKNAAEALESDMSDSEEDISESEDDMLDAERQIEGNQATEEKQTERQRAEEKREDLKEGMQKAQEQKQTMQKNAWHAEQEKKISITLKQTENKVLISVADTGRGLPEEERQSLVEPYITTRSQGTGLGLAIAKKVMEDHGGQLLLEDAPWVSQGKTGAQITLQFPYNSKQMVGTSRVEEKIL